MSIITRVGDPLLARMLYLEAKRQGLGEDTPILFIDPAVESIPEPIEGQLTVGITASPDLVTTAETRKLFALLPLPFSAKELAVVVRRFREGREQRVERTGDLLYLNGKRIAFSHTEAALFDLLFDNRHRLVSESEMTALLGESAKHTNTLAVYLHRLRRKLGEDGRCIRTVRGKGCQWIT